MHNWTDKDREAFGRRLKLAREAADLTQSAVAKELGYGEEKKGTVSAWEVGSNMPTAETIARLADLYRVSADVLLFGDSTIGPDGTAIGEAYEALSPEEKMAFKALWIGWITGVKGPLTPDKGVAAGTPLANLPAPIRKVLAPSPLSTRTTGPHRTTRVRGGIDEFRESGRDHPKHRPPGKAATKKR